MKAAGNGSPWSGLGPTVRRRISEGVPIDDEKRCGATIRLLPADVAITALPGESIVDAVRRHGYRTRYSCRRGGCGACKADLVTGQVTYCVPIADSVLTATERADGRCLPCRAVPDGDVVVRLAERDRLRRPFAFLDPTIS
jgi:CDP-4-dehydro-6-deoxyglucose reductase